MREVLVQPLRLLYLVDDRRRVMIEITAARKEHVQQIEALVTLGLREQEVFAASCVPSESDDFFDRELDEHLEGLKMCLDQWTVALAETSEVVGTLWLQFHGDRLGPYGTVRQVVVAPRHRGRGIGTELLSCAESAVRDSDAVMFLISALRPNPAHRLYRSLGFSDLPSAFRQDRNPEHVVLWKWFGVGAPEQTS